MLAGAGRGRSSAAPPSAAGSSPIGGNRTAATLAGLPVRRTLLAVYVICGVLAALAGVLNTARLGASDPSFVGLLIELSAITAVVVGGTPLTGGRVRVLGTLAGALLMQLIIATLIQHNLPDSVARMIQAVIIVVAVYVQRDRGGSMTAAVDLRNRRRAAPDAARRTWPRRRAARRSCSSLVLRDRHRRLRQQLRQRPATSATSRWTARTWC